MKELCSRIKDNLNEYDRFAKSNGMRITALSEGRAETELVLEERHLNGLDIVMGGVIFTLADFALAAAANSYGFQAVAMNSAISFLRPGNRGPGSIIRATVSVLAKGRRTATFHADVVDDAGVLLASGLMTASLLRKPFFPEA